VEEQSSFIRPDEHVFIAGMTGSGKSFFAETYLAGYEYVVKLDTKGEVFERKQKGEPVWRGLREGKDYTVIEHLADLENVPTKKIIYCPAFEEQTIEYYDALCKWVYERQNTILWVDELMSISESPLRYPLHLRAIMTRGRSRNTSIWALTQRPMDIPTIIPANTTHFIMFNLQMNQDREKMARMTGVYEFMQNPGWHYFWYWKSGVEHATRAILKP
jgi:hypothetical protein